MTHETGKAVARRLRDIRFATRYFTGDLIDIGSGDDPFDRYAGLFPLVTSVRCWDKVHGDALLMPGIANNSFDCVHSSHCLEHLTHPRVALRKWISICKPGGHLVITVPDEDLYEKGQWPSRFNAEHKWSFGLSNLPDDARPQSLNLLEVRYRVEILSVQLLDAGYDKTAPPVYDQSLMPTCEPAIEFILRKRAIG